MFDTARHMVDSVFIKIQYAYTVTVQKYKTGIIFFLLFLHWQFNFFFRTVFGTDLLKPAMTYDLCSVALSERVLDV